MVHQSIIECEERLIDAQRKSDVQALDQLLHDDLLFTIPNGQIITKQIDLESHRSGGMIVYSNTPSEQVIKLIEDTAVVTVVVDLKGKYNGQMFAGSAVQIA